MFGNSFKEHDFNIAFHYLGSPCKSCHLHWVRLHSWYIFSPKGVLPQPTYEIRTFSSMASSLACHSFHFFWLDSYLLWFPGTLSIWLLFRCVLTRLFFPSRNRICRYLLRFFPRVFKITKVHVKIKRIVPIWKFT